MNDRPRPHELDEREALAASAVVDGIETADERALVAGSPQLEAWIESYHHIIAELDDVPVPAATRESALSAALAVFDELHTEQRADGHDVDERPDVPVVTAATEHAAATGTVVPLAARRRRWQPRLVLGAAAAVVAVLAIGGVIANQNGSDDDLSSSATAAPIDDASRKTGETASPAADQIAAAAPAGTATPAMTIDAIPGAADVGTAAPAMSQESQEAGTAAGDAPAATEAPADTAAPDTLSTFSTITERVPDQQALVAYAQRASAGGTGDSRPAPAPAPTSACATDGVEVLGDVLYGPDEVPARVVRDLTTGAVRAEALDTCQVLTSVTP